MVRVSCVFIARRLITNIGYEEEEEDVEKEEEEQEEEEQERMS